MYHYLSQFLTQRLEFPIHQVYSTLQLQYGRTTGILVLNLNLVRPCVHGRTLGIVSDLTYITSHEQHGAAPPVHPLTLLQYCFGGGHCFYSSVLHHGYGPWNRG